MKLLVLAKAERGRQPQRVANPVQTRPVKMDQEVKGPTLSRPRKGCDTLGPVLLSSRWSTLWGFRAAREQKVKAAAAGRDLLDLGDDSDSSASSAESDNGRKPKVDNPLEGTLHNVHYRGAKFKTLVMKRRLYVEARADVAQTIVAACLKATLEVVKEETKLEVEGPLPAPQLVTVVGEDGPDGSKEPKGPRVANPSGRCIRFDSRRSCYEITYVADVDGVSVSHRCIKGLLVKCQDKGGKRFTPEKCDEQMTRAYEKAKKLWNESDQSDRARLE